MVDDWKPKCPYLSCIGEKFITCALHCRNKYKKEFNSMAETHLFADSICFKSFDMCPVYHEIYAEEMSSNDKWILHYRKCGFCCNNSGYLGLKYNNGSTHVFCQLKKAEVECFNPSTVCEWFNKKAGTVINNIFDFLTNISP